jgi:nicotinate-nucleotide--dimethylbenzimidazole phosphoribosyltransferase
LRPLLHLDPFVIWIGCTAGDPMTEAVHQLAPFARIPPLDAAVRTAARHHVDVLTKPLGALGRLEPLAVSVCAMQGTLRPEIKSPVAIVFAADHGIADRGVSAYPRAVTAQMVQNFLAGGAAISVLARFQAMDLWVVDAGVDGDCGNHPRLLNAKIRCGTRDLVAESAMTAGECQAALLAGKRVLEQVAAADSNTAVLGEMGIGNTAAAALLMHRLTGLPLADCVGRGTGLDDAGLERKRATLATASRRVTRAEPLELLCEFGGYEIAMLVGALLAAAARRMLIVVDGFTVTVAVALAARLDRAVLDYCVFGHCSAEQAHRALLQHLEAEPLLDLGMRLGEGTGAALALAVIRAAIALFTDMATFESAGVSNRDG